MVRRIKLAIPATSEGNVPVIPWDDRIKVCSRVSCETQSGIEPTNDVPAKFRYL